MSKRRAFLIRILLVIVVIGCLTHTSWGQGNGIVNISNPSSLPARSAFSDEDILNHAQRSLDRSISTFNIVATLMGVLIGLVALIVAIGSALGFLGYRRWQEVIEQVKKSTEETKEYADEAKKAAEQARPIIDKLKKTEEEIDTFRERAKHFPSLSEPFSEDQKKILDEYGKKIDSLEAIGVPLKPEDYFNRGADFYQRGEYELALKAMDKAIELKPDYSGAWYNKACSYSLKGDKENALKNLSKAIDLDAKYKEEVKSDEDFKNLWDDEDFKRIVS